MVTSTPGGFVGHLYRCASTRRRPATASMASTVFIAQVQRRLPVAGLIGGDVRKLLDQLGFELST